MLLKLRESVFIADNRGMLLRFLLIFSALLFFGCVPTNKTNSESSDDASFFNIQEVNSPATNSNNATTTPSQVQNSTTSSSSTLSSNSSSSATIFQQLTGTIQYERVPLDDEGKLDYENRTYQPVRYAKVKAFIPKSLILVDETATDANGNYTLTVTQQTTVQLYIYAQTDQFNIQVENNSSNDAVYYHKSLVINPFSTTKLDVNIASGWTGDAISGAYLASKDSGPFAILDTLIKGCQTLRESQIKLHITEDDFCNNTLKVNWVNNSDLNTQTFFNSVDNEIYVRSKEDTNTDEFDEHVLLYNFSKYFLYNSSRDNSLNGLSTESMTLSPEQAFTDGFSQALAGIILEDSNFRDSGGVRGRTPLKKFSLEYQPQTEQNAFNILTIRETIWDMWDKNNTGYDTLTIELEKILLAIKTSDFTQGSALATFYSFASNFYDHYAYYEQEMKSLTQSRGINITSAYGDGETNSVNSKARLPIYQVVLVDSPAVTLNFAGNEQSFNEALNVHRIRFSTSSSNTTRYRISVNSVSNVNVELFDNGKVAVTTPQVPSISNTSHTIEVCDPILDIEDEYLLRIFQSPLSTSVPFTATVQVTSIPGDCP